MAGVLGFLPHRDRHLRARMDVVEGGGSSGRQPLLNPGRRRVGGPLGYESTEGLPRHVPGLGTSRGGKAKIHQSRRALEEPLGHDGQQGGGAGGPNNPDSAGHTFHDEIPSIGLGINPQVELSEVELFTMEGDSPGVKGHAVVGDQKTEHERQLATMSQEWGDEEDRREEGLWREEEELDTNEKWEEGFDFSFPPVPPMKTSEVRSESIGGLLHLVKRRRAMKEKPEEETAKATERRSKRELSRGLEVQVEGKGRASKKRAQRKDLPQRPVQLKGVKKNEKWKKAIQTARIFRSNQSQRDRGLQDFQKGY